LKNPLEPEFTSALRKRSENELANVSIGESSPQTQMNLESAEIETRAYEIYLARGGAQANDLADWLQAERELRGE
jgi:hypothetical protein